MILSRSSVAVAGTLALGPALVRSAAVGSFETRAGDISPAELGLLPRGTLTSCGTSGAASCHNTTTQTDLCCFEAPGGLFLQTQFWDFNPSTGPTNSWTIHGLWPDHCDLTYSENCDSSRAYKDIGTILKNAGQSSLVDYMNTYMIPNSGTPESFWEHEWSTHGTCLSTLKPSCIPSGSQTGQDAVYYFERIVALFKTLPTYTWLANAGFTPDSSKTYSLSTLTSALKSGSGGYTPALDCTSGSLSSISWYFNLKGSVIDGTFVPITAPESGSCPSSGIKYPPKSGGGTAPTSTTSGGGSAPTGVPSKATIKGLTSSGSTVGCLLTAGTWSVQTCATYTIAGSGSGITLKTSKGPCAVSGGTLTCSSGTTASVFGSTTSGSNLLLTYSGSSTFSAAATPSGTDQETVYTGSSKSVSLSFVITST